MFTIAAYSTALRAAVCSPGIPCTGYDVNVNASDNDTKSTNGACDGNFMNQIYARAFMEASREVIMSEQIIHKPDSVLEYTCFDQFVSYAAKDIGPLFSESQHWKNMDVELWTAGYDSKNNGVQPDHGTTTTINSAFSDTHLDNILEDFLLEILEDYIDDNFEHTFLGEALTIDNTISSTIGNAIHACPNMALVWYLSKCLDFGEDDRFRSFEHLVNYDPRSIPQACSPANISNDSVEDGQLITKLEITSAGTTGILGGFPSGGLSAECLGPDGPLVDVKTGLSNDIINVSNNCSNAVNINAYSSFQGMNAYNEIIKGYNSPTITCSDPIPTGVPIISYDLTTFLNPDKILTIGRSYEFHYDHVCPNAGCYYDPNKAPYIWGNPIPAPSTKGTCKPI